LSNLFETSEYVYFILYEHIGLKWKKKMSRFWFIWPLTQWVYVFARKDVCFDTCEQVACKMSFVWSVLKILFEKMTSRFFKHKLLIQAVKYFFFSERIFDQSFFGVHPCLVIFFSRKSSVFQHELASRLLERCLLSVEKCFLSVVFAVWRWDCSSVYIPCSSW